MFRKLILIFFMFLPSLVKVKILKICGHKIGKRVRIGFSYIDSGKIILGDDVSISSFNYIKGLSRLEMMNNSRIGGFGNWFTSSKLFKSDSDKGVLIIGDSSNITGRHYFDLQGKIIIGKNILIAGFGSTFFTHGYTPDNPFVVRDITIGSNCYIGSHCFFTPGSMIGDNSFVAANTTVSRDFSKYPNSLIAQEPAVIKKKYSEKSTFFNIDFKGFKPKKTF